MTAVKTSIKRADSPESAGVSLESISEFIEDLNNSHLEVHSIMVLRHGQVAFESWSSPYGPDIPHAMYSVSKSFTSAAVGFAIDEGLITLKTKVIDIFPEFKPAKPDKNLERLTIFHLLTMTAGKDVSLLANRAKNQWIHDFFKAKWKFAPGESWRYVNDNIFILCAVLTKVTGMPVVDYLTPRLFGPLGYGRQPFWETDPNGIEAGGWGLFLTTEELAKFSLCYLQGGIYEGSQVIPADWVREATRWQAESISKNADGSFGYGYCFWRNSCPDSYRSDGMFSQFGIVFEKFDAVLVITASEIVEQNVRDCIWRHFPKAFIDESDDHLKKDIPKLKPILKPLEELASAPRSPLEEIIAGREIKVARQRLLRLAKMPLSMLPMAVVYMSADKAGNIDKIKLDFDENECTMKWNEGRERNSITCGFDGKPRTAPIHLAGIDFTVSGTAMWKGENILSIWIRPLESVCQRRIDFVFNGDRANLFFSSWPETKSMLSFLSSNVDEYVKNPVIIKAVQGFMQKAHRIVEPKYRGRFVNQP